MSRLQSTALCASMIALAACSKGTTGNEGDSDEPPLASEDDSDDASASNSASFVPDVSGGDSACDIWTQDCPEDEKCMPWSSMEDTWDANKCVPVLGTGRTGDECSSDGAAQATDTCDVGFMCYYIEDDWVGICMPLCAGTPASPECPEGFNCSIANDGTLPLCVYACDPVLQDCALEGTGCFWDGAAFNCDPAGSLLGNEACAYINDCAPGFMCVDAAALPECLASACCSSFCDLTQPHCELPGAECLAFFDDGTAPPGLENVGICSLPGT